MELWELIARERIRDSLARYTWSGDALRLDELALAFHEDGELEVRGQPPRRGRQAIIEFLGGVSPGGGAPPGTPSSAPPGPSAGATSPAASAGPGPRRIVRHNLANIRFLEISPDEARVASYFTVVTEIGLDHYGRYRDTFVPVGDEWLIRHRYVSTDWRAPDSTMAPPSSIR
ncbi:SnoaL-like domain-containing protein [Frankia sp. AiPs1]|uniref:nuclear transport factor 2 family protein n=1 Tax=Frankia sp. AiPa1 TaxID=573492 RepID=UPI00202B4FDA|nr:nuclear transport factor 2 family protein [Frankia sp. AiPa1]MCL9759993.1 nuclear transport factor 2 family protein [Frankia sp. AiPa1]